MTRGTKDGMILLLSFYMKRKILIIDDEFELCMLLKLHLTAKGYEVEMAYNLKDGLSKLDSYDPDIIFLDNGLPDGEGWEAAAKIISEHPAIKISLISGESVQRLPDEMGNNLYLLEKPLSRHEIDDYLNYISEGKL
jgi:DNA-binding response OmpR family regulator